MTYTTYRCGAKQLLTPDHPCLVSVRVSVSSTIKPTYITQIVYSHTIYSRNISIIHICQYSHWLCLKMTYPKTICLWFETLFTIVLFHHYEHVLPIWRFPKIELPQSSEKKHEINHPFMEFPIYH